MLIKSLQNYGFKGSYENLNDAQFETAIIQLKHIFSKYFAASYVESSFKLPNDYIEFIKSITSYLSTGNYHTLYSIDEVVKGTKGFLIDGEHYFLKRKKSNSPITTDVMWITIGWWSDKHDLILCCDCSSAYWGKIYDVWDDHPWSGENFTTAAVYDNIEDYVSQLLENE